METSEARRVNRSAVLARVLAVGSCTRGELAIVTGLSPATVSRVVDALIAEGLIAEGPEVASGRRGRNAAAVQVNPELGVVCGVDLGGTNCRFLLADLLGNPAATRQELTPVSLPAAGIAGWVAARVTELAAGGTGPLRAVAVGLPGVVSPDESAVSGAPNLPQIEGDAFVRALAELIPAPVRLANDSNLALLGEFRFGAGRGLGTVVMFTVGTGLGSGVALDGQLLRGRTGLVGEFGYLPVGPAGATAEEVLSGAGLMRRARALAAPVSAPQQIFAPHAPVALGELREQFDRALLLIMTAATVAYEPDAIIIGGGLTPVISARLDGVRQRLGELVPALPDLRLAELGNLSGALGAVAAACGTAYLGLGITGRDAAMLPTPAALEKLRRPESEAADVPGTPSC
jgi:predicted NBD/HSP70 family sugar kinase